MSMTPNANIPGDPFGRGELFEWPGCFWEAQLLINEFDVYDTAEEFIRLKVIEPVLQDDDLPDDLTNEITQALVDKYAAAAKWDMPHLVASALNRYLREDVSSVDYVEVSGGKTRRLTKMGTYIFWRDLFPLFLVIDEPVTSMLWEAGFVEPNVAHIRKGFLEWLGPRALINEKQHRSPNSNWSSERWNKSRFEQFVKRYQASREGCLRCLQIASVEEGVAASAVEEAFSRRTLVPIRDALLDKGCEQSPPIASSSQETTLKLGFPLDKSNMASNEELLAQSAATEAKATLQRAGSLPSMRLDTKLREAEPETGQEKPLTKEEEQRVAEEALWSEAQQPQVRPGIRPVSIKDILTEVSYNVMPQIWVDKGGNATFEGTYGGYSETRSFMKEAKASNGATPLKFAKGECDHVLQSFHGIPTKTRDQDRSNDDAISVVVPPAFHTKKTQYEKALGGQGINLYDCSCFDQSYATIIKGFRQLNLSSVEKHSADLLNPINVRNSYKLAWRDQLAQLVEQGNIDGFNANEAIPHYTVGVLNESFDGVHSKFMNLNVKAYEETTAVMESESSTRRSSILQTWNKSMTLKRMRINTETLCDEMRDLLRVARYWEHRLSTSHGSACPQATTYRRTIKHGIRTFNHIIDDMVQKERQLGKTALGSLLRTQSKMDETKAEALKTDLYDSVGVDKDGVIQTNATLLTDEQALLLMRRKGIGNGKQKCEVQFPSLTRSQRESLKSFMSEALKLGRSTSRGIDP